MLVRRATRIRECRRLRPNTQAAIPTAKAPEPQAVNTTTLNVFQIPHPNLSFMPLAGPRPTTSRQTVRKTDNTAKPTRSRKSGLISETPYTGTARSQRVLLPVTDPLRALAGTLFRVAVLIIAPS